MTTSQPHGFYIVQHWVWCFLTFFLHSQLEEWTDFQRRVLGYTWTVSTYTAWWIKGRWRGIVRKPADRVAKLRWWCWAKHQDNLSIRSEITYFPKFGKIPVGFWKMRFFSPPLTCLIYSTAKDFGRWGGPFPHSTSILQVICLCGKIHWSSKKAWSSDPSTWEATLNVKRCTLKGEFHKPLTVLQIDISNLMNLTGYKESWPNQGLVFPSEYFCTQ